MGDDDDKKVLEAVAPVADRLEGEMMIPMMMVEATMTDMAERLLESHRTRRRGLLADVKRAFALAKVAYFRLHQPGPRNQASLSALEKEVLLILRQSGAPARARKKGRRHSR